MRHVMKIAAIAGVFAGLACAETWNGRLLDATCIDQQKSAACDPNENTVAFAINLAGKIYRLDDAGNGKAVEALKGRADRTKDPNVPNPAAVSAKVTGSIEGEVLKVETIEVQ